MRTLEFAVPEKGLTVFLSNINYRAIVRKQQKMCVDRDLCEKVAAGELVHLRYGPSAANVFKRGFLKQGYRY